MHKSPRRSERSHCRCVDQQIRGLALADRPLPSFETRNIKMIGLNTVANFSKAIAENITGSNKTARLEETTQSIDAEAKQIVKDVQEARSILYTDNLNRDHRKMVQDELEVAAGWLIGCVCGYDDSDYIIDIDPVFVLAERDLQLRETISRLVIAEMDDAIFRVQDLEKAGGHEMLVEQYRRKAEDRIRVAVLFGSLGYEGVINHADWFDPTLKQKIERRGLGIIDPV